MPICGAIGTRLAWRKARRSVGDGACVEVARADQWIFVRDSKDPSGPVIAWGDPEWRAFTDAAKLGRYDRLR